MQQCCLLGMWYEVWSQAQPAERQNTFKTVCACAHHKLLTGLCIHPSIVTHTRTHPDLPLPEPGHNSLQDNVTLEELAAEDVSRDVKGWLQRADAWLFEMDLFESVPASTTLMRIHSTAEEYEAVAEEFMAPFQVIPPSEGIAFQMKARLPSRAVPAFHVS